MENGFQKGYIPWNKGLTKDSHPSMKRISDAQVGREGYWKNKKRPDIKGNLNIVKYGKDNIFSKIKFTGSNHANWKGDKVGYDALHNWVARELGKPDTCEHCGRSGLRGRFIQWANKSGEYLRDLNDWIRLCAKCHYAYDRK